MKRQRRTGALLKRERERSARQVLNYCLQVWLRWRSRHGGARGLPLIVPLVLYPGTGTKQYEREFAALFADGESAWRWVPRFEYVLIDQTRQRPETVPGALPARLAQIAMWPRFATLGKSCWSR